MYALMAVVFVMGYLMIAFEHAIKIDKAASAILTAVLTWSILVLGVDQHASQEVRHHLGEIAEILFFLLGAMTIVELVDAHEGFRMIKIGRASCRERRNICVTEGSLKKDTKST